MIRNKEQIFTDLDKHASEFNFPVLDNAYVEFAATRLTAFQSAKGWLIVFEVLGFSTKEIEFVDDLYAFGSCVEREGYVGEEVLLSSSRGQPIFDTQSNDCIADWSHWSIKLGNETMFFSPTREEYANAGIVIDRDPGPGTLREIELLRFLVYRLGEERLFMNDETLLSHFPRCQGVSKFIQTARWQHPDVADGERPSTTLSIRTLVAALSQKDVSLFEPGRPNTHWRSWVRAA